MDYLLESINLFFYGIFFIEMVIKLTAFGCKSYFSKRSNTFDFFIVFLSTIDLVAFIYNAISESSLDDHQIQELKEGHIYDSGLNMYKLGSLT